MNALGRAKVVAEYVTDLRQTIHQHAELSFKEYETTAIIVEELKRLGLEVTTWRDFTGATGLLRGGHPGPTIALRADIDALPIQEATGASYASKNPGVMHACAHDAHAAIILGVAKLLAEQRSELKGNLKLIFQPAEELPPGGALELIKRGVLDDPRVDAMFACHHATEFPVGQIGIHYGGFMASADQFSLTVVCRGGGGSAPHKGVDGIAVAAQIVTGLQYMLTRQIDPVKPAVLSFGTLHAGARFNILADRVEMTGTCRALDADTAERFPDRILKVAQGIAATYDAQVELKYERGYPTLANDDKVTAILEEAAKEAIGPSNVKVADPIMAGDDLAYFFRKVPGSYFWLGISNPAKGIIHPAHTARFDIDEEALPVAVAVMVQTVLKGFDHLPA